MKHEKVPRMVLFLAGSPATGKSYWAEKITSQYPFFKIVAFDKIKELFFEKLGFRNKQEKEAVIQLALEVFYQEVERKLEAGLALILEYPFSYKQKETLEGLLNEYHYEAITITFICDLRILYKRQYQRNLEATRHLGHIMTHYQSGDVLLDKSKADDLDSFETFSKRCIAREYADFRIGAGIKLDVTNYEDINERQVMEWLEEQITGYLK